MPPDPAGTATRGLGNRLPTVPAILRDDHDHLVHLLDRQQRAVGPAMAGLAATLPTGQRGGGTTLLQDCGGYQSCTTVRYSSPAARIHKVE